VTCTVQDPTGPFSLSSLDEACDVPGFTGSSVLASTQDEYVTTLAYDPAAEGNVTGLTITRSYSGGTLICSPMVDPCPGMPCGAAQQPASITMELDIQIRTADGALDEAFTATLSAYEYGGGALETVEIPAAELGGQLDFDMPGFTDLSLIVSAQLSTESAQGSLFKKGRSVDYPHGTQKPLGTFPAPEQAIGLTGAWGGDQVSLDLDARPRALEFECATGTIDAPVVPGKDGKFTVAGTYAPAQPPSEPQPATYRGWTDGEDEMLLSVKVSGEAEERGPFTLYLGQAPSLDKCQ
jgi:hypothetical protein